jgi:LruC domain-containing protein
MKRFFYFAIIILGLSALIGTGTSCKKEMFDRAMYDTLITIQSPVDSVDPSHTWELSTSKYLIITANAGTGTRQVQILSDNPLTSNDAQIINQLDMAEGDRVGLSVSYPNNLTTLYAAAIDSTGAYTVVQFNPSNRDVDFSNPISKAQQVSLKPAPQYYAFCYEQEYPEPGDYDYNDVVMHIALERANPREMYVHVRLAAVGADIQLAGCLRLPEIDYDDIDTVYTVGDKSFNKDISDQYMMVQKSRDLLLKGRNGEPILNLFADAHWATGDILNADFGIFQRKKYNVTTKSDDKSQLMVPREVIFVLRFKTETQANSITLDNIDPFIMRLYNGASMEVHTYKYRESTALEEYQYIDVGHLPWAMKVPEGSFCHPLHAVNMGFRMKNASGLGIMFGAYATTGHAFGEWAMDKNKATDWYFYPDTKTPNVFVW